MSLLKSIEFFFASKVKHHIPFALKTNDAPKKEIPIASFPIQKESQPSFLPKKEEPKVPVPTPKKTKAKEPSKDAFYTEWEKKYRALQAESLLAKEPAKEPAKKHALFIINENAPKAFAEKIAGAVNTRLMKTTFLVSNKSLEELIKEHSPTHLITDKEVQSSLPTIFIGNLNEIENNAEKKKALWNTLQQKLKN